MRLCRLLKLSHAEFRMRRKTILFSVLAAGIPLIILLTYSLLSSGVERIFLEYSSKPTDGVVYLVLEGNGNNTTRYVTENSGEILHEITAEEAHERTPMEIFREYTGVYDPGLQEGVLATGQNGFQPVDIFLNNISSYHAPFMDDKEKLEMTLLERRVVIVKFPDVTKAHNYSEELIEHYSRTEYEEIFSNLLRTYNNFRSADKANGILRGLILSMSAVILIGTYVYLLDQELRSMVIYRALGASSADMLIIALGYLVEVGLAIIMYVIGASLLICGIVTLLNAGYVLGLMEEFYGAAPKIIYLAGWNMNLVWIVLLILTMAPVSLLLTIDQFSVKRLARKMKKD